MRIVVFGLAVSSSWGNGHATLWRGLIRALGALGHHVTFFERDVPYYAMHRDMTELPGGDLVLFQDFGDIAPRVRAALACSDAAIVTSFCPDGCEVVRMLRDAPRPVRLFYDLDTPVTLERLARGEALPELDDEGLAAFDMVLSYTGGPALTELRRRGARQVRPFHGWVDEALHRPAAARVDVAGAAMTYLGTYAADRQDALETLLIATARARPTERFVIGGAQYPAAFPWADNIWFVRHVPPDMHPAFYAAGRLTLNVTRGTMAAMGWCPSGRLFEAAACGTPLVSDDFPGLADFFTAGEEIVVARCTADTLAAVEMGEAELARMARRARERVLAEHTAWHRARTLTEVIAMARNRGGAA